jgi:hypothetical protein
MNKEHKVIAHRMAVQIIGLVVKLDIHMEIRDEILEECVVRLYRQTPKSVRTRLAARLEAS